MKILPLPSLEAMRDVDIRTVDPASLVDIRDTKVKTELPPMERIQDFITQIKNPYCFLCGKTVVRIKFADTNTTMEERMEGYFRSL